MHKLTHVIYFASTAGSVVALITIFVLLLIAVVNVTSDICFRVLNRPFARATSEQYVALFALPIMSSVGGGLVAVGVEHVYFGHGAEDHRKGNITFLIGFVSLLIIGFSCLWFLSTEPRNLTSKMSVAINTGSGMQEARDAIAAARDELSARILPNRRARRYIGLCVLFALIADLPGGRRAVWWSPLVVAGCVLVATLSWILQAI